MSTTKPKAQAETSCTQAPASKKEPRERSVRAEPVLRFSPTAWAKLLFFRDRGQTEIGGFGVCAADDLLRVEEFAVVRQQASMASVSFDDAAVADFFDSQVDLSRTPEQFGRVWLHTHPGNSAEPSLTDHETFARVFGGCEWAVMFILAQGGKTSARLRFNVGPGGRALIPVEVDFVKPFAGSDYDAWEAEYRASVRAESFDEWSAIPDEAVDRVGFSEPTLPDEWLDDFEAMEPAERQYILDELAVRPDLWGESEVNDEY